MLRTTIVGLGWRGNTLVKATRAFGVPLNLSTGDSTTALIELESGAAGTLDPTINTSCDWQLAIYRTNCHAESASETCTIACGAGRDSEGIDRPPDNHLGRNLDYSAKAALVQSTFRSAQRDPTNGCGAGSDVSRSMFTAPG